MALNRNIPQSHPAFSYAEKDYDPRWFVWTIVFLVVTGISLVSYIILSDVGTAQVPTFAASRVELHKAQSQNQQ
jgi:cytochrome c-type biogenesis protein CcmH/NrfG